MRTTGNSLSFDSTATMRSVNDRAIVLPFVELDDAPRARVVVRGGGRLRVMSAELDNVAQAAPREGRMAHASDHLFFGMTTEGESVASQRGRDLVVSSGDGVLLARGEDGFRLLHRRAVRFVGLRFERRELSAVLPNVDDVVATRVSRDDGALVLLASYLRCAIAGELLDGEPGAVVARHVIDLLALSLGATRDARALAAERSVGEARMRVIERDVLAQLDDPSLSPSAIARRHGVSRRWIHKLFERRGVTFAAFVLEQRLLRARTLLEDPRNDTRTITAIASDVGFRDVSYFNRTFRRRFGATPSDIRRSR